MLIRQTDEVEHLPSLLGRHQWRAPPLPAQLLQLAVYAPAIALIETVGMSGGITQSIGNACPSIPSQTIPLDQVAEMQNAVDIFASASSPAGSDHSKSFIERATSAGKEITNGSRVPEAALVLEELGDLLKP